MSSKNFYELVPLHHNPSYREDCILILNHEWPRGRTLRLRSLLCSSDEFPVSLVLLKKNGKTNMAIGHGRLNLIPNKYDSLWVESVIIHHDYRGKGLGKILMTEIENYALNLGFTNLILSTHDQQEFYSKLGYSFCPSVTMYGAAVNRKWLPEAFLKRFFNINLNTGSTGSSETKQVTTCKKEKKIETKINSSPIASAPLPPPPPPPPLKKSDIVYYDSPCKNKKFMTKALINKSLLSLEEQVKQIQY